MGDLGSSNQCVWGGTLRYTQLVRGKKIEEGAAFQSRRNLLALSGGVKVIQLLRNSSLGRSYLSVGAITMVSQWVLL